MIVPVKLKSAYSRVFNRGKNNLQAVFSRTGIHFSIGAYNIEHGYADMLALGRQSLADPKLPSKYLADKEGEINWCTCSSSLSLPVRHAASPTPAS